MARMAEAKLGAAAARDMALRSATGVTVVLGEPTHGGKRKGAGRKPKYPSGRMTQFIVAMPAELRNMLNELVVWNRKNFPRRCKNWTRSDVLREILEREYECWLR